MQKVSGYVGNNETILDIGCGYHAFFLRSIEKKIKSGIGLDYEVESTCEGKIKLKKYRFENNLPFDSEYFDRAFMLAVLEHISLTAVELLFKEINRILKPNGQLILTTPTTSGKYIMEFLAYRMNLISFLEIADHKKYYTKKDIEELAHKSGLKLIKYIKFQLGLNSLCILGKI